MCSQCTYFQQARDENIRKYDDAMRKVESLKCKVYTPQTIADIGCNIRASVDALCRDGTSEISRDPRTKRLRTRRESLARPSKHTNNNF